MASERNSSLFNLNEKNAIYITLLFLSFALNAGKKDLTDQQVVALTILGEARGEGAQGMYGVA